MFWGLILKSNKKYTQTIEKPFHLSKASLDHASSDDGPVQVMYTHEENSYLLCTLQKGKVLQCSLDLNFDGEKVCFSTKGNGIVHLTGYLMDDEFSGMDGLGSDEEMSEDEMAEAEIDKKLKMLEKKQPKKASKQQQEDSDDSDEDEDEDESDEENGNADESIEAEEEDSDEDEDDEDDDDEEEDSDEEAEEPPKKQAKTENGHAQKNGKDGKKKDKNEKAQNGEKKPQKENKQEQGKIHKLQGGLVAQELKVGNGAEARPGKKVQVYYEGRLKSNNKVFDSAKAGKGFKFGLGKGEVIKGWDLGITGMKVGGKRRLVIPPALAYGSAGSPPVIPQNATLIFDVELKNVF